MEVSIDFNTTFIAYEYTLSFDFFAPQHEHNFEDG